MVVAYFENAEVEDYLSLRNAEILAIFD